MCPASLEAFRDEMDRLWARQQELAKLVVEMDSSFLDEEDLAERERISRINFGYSYFLMECYPIIENANDLDDVDPILIETIQGFTPLIDSHCDESTNALQWAMRGAYESRPVIYAYG